jgi:hypothetical protein
MMMFFGEREGRVVKEGDCMGKKRIREFIERVNRWKTFLSDLPSKWRRAALSGHAKQEFCLAVPTTAQVR